MLELVCVILGASAFSAVLLAAVGVRQRSAARVGYALVVVTSHALLCYLTLTSGLSRIECAGTIALVIQIIAYLLVMPFLKSDREYLWVTCSLLAYGSSFWLVVNAP